MEMNTMLKKFTVWIKKYKFVALIIITGLMLMMIPYNGKKSQVVINDSAVEEKMQSVEDRLTEILTQIDGVGKVSVMLTVARGEEIIYQTDEQLTTGENSIKEDIDTVTVTDADRNQNGLVRQTNPPVYQGAIIICQGADDPVVRYAVTEAVARITGLKTNCISVLKMK